MPQPTTRLHLPQPCPESWDAMTPTSTGRHCAACQKTVVDFTHKTDAEILAALRQATGETCGRLRADQLGRSLVAPAPAPQWRAWLGAALALGGLLWAGRAAAQSQRDSYYAGPRPMASPTASPVATGPSQAAALAHSATVPGPSGPFTVRGVVQDATTHEGLPGVTVLLKGTTTEASTDANGAFELVIPASGASAALAFSFVGYVGQEYQLAPGSSQPLAVTLAADAKLLMGEVVVVGDVGQKPWPWHPRRFFNWGKYWVTRPFRE
jgi:hypothetical protein